MEPNLTPITMLSSIGVLILLLVVSTHLQVTQAFKCYVCDSKFDNECVEKLPHNSMLKPQDCNELIEPKYCIKTSNMYAGELGTKRFCAANDHGNYCTYVKQPTGDQEFRSCVFTCTSESCNSAPTSTYPTNLPYYVTLISLLYNLCTLSMTYLSRRICMRNR